MTTIELHWYSAPPTGSSELLLDTLDLFDKADGLQMAYNGLARAVGDREAATIKETFTLRADGADFDELAGVLQTLDLWQKRVAWSLNEVDTHEVWILMQMGDETYGLEAQVLDLQYSVGDDILNYSEPHVNQLTVVIQRTPWEAAKDETIPSLAFSAGALGGMDEATGDGSVTSDLPARVASLSLTCAEELTECWLALQSNLLRDPAAFIPVWSLSAADPLNCTRDTQNQFDNDAFDGTAMVCDFSDGEEARQLLSVALVDVAREQGEGFDPTNFYTQSGHYEVLLRAHVSNGDTEVHLRIGYGWLREWPLVVNSITWRDLTIVTSTSYMLHDLQSIAIPPTKVADDHRNFAITIEGERVAGTGSLYLDCVGVLPLDEGAIHVQFPAATGTNRVLRIDVAPDGRRSGYVLESGLIIDQAAVDAEVWEMPMNAVRPNLVAFGQRSTYSSLTDTIAVEMDYCRRFRLLRGAE